MLIKAQIDYLVGHLRYGHFEANVPDKDLEKFKLLTPSEKKIYIKEIGNIIVDDYSLEDYGDLGDVEMYVG